MASIEENEVVNYEKDLRKFVEIRKEKPNKIDTYDDLIEWPISETEVRAFQSVRKKDLTHFKELNLKNLDIEYKGKRLVFEAVLNDKFEILKDLIERGADINALDKYGRNILQVAVLYNDTDNIAMHLLEAKYFAIGAGLELLLYNHPEDLRNYDLNETDSSGSTIVHYICARGSVRAFKSLRSADEPEKYDELRNFDYTKRDNEGFTCIDRAAANGRVEMITELIDFFQINTDFSNPIVESILLKTLKYANNDKVLDWWLQTVANQPMAFNDRNKWLFEINGITADALILKLRLLLEYNCDLNVADERDNNLIMKTVEKYDGAMTLNLLYWLIPDEVGIEYLCIKNKLSQTLAHLSAIEGNLDIFELCSICDVDLQEEDCNSVKSYIYAIKNGHFDIVKFLLENESSKLENIPNLANLAIINKHNETFKLLVESSKGFKFPDMKLNFDEEINGEAHPARLLRITENAEAALSCPNGFILNILKNCKLENLNNLRIPFRQYEDNEKATAIHVLSLFGRNDVILWLALFGFDIHSKDKNGYTGLYYAIYNNQISTVLLLIILGLNYTNANDKKATSIESNLVINALKKVDEQSLAYMKTLLENNY